MIKNLLYLFFVFTVFNISQAKEKPAKYEFFCDTLAPLNVTITNISHTYAVVNWANDPNTTNYVIRFRLAGNFPWFSSVVPTGQNFFNLNGLMSCTAYEVQVAKLCNSVQGTWSSSLIFNTLSPDSCVSFSTDSSLMHISNVTFTPASGFGLLTMISNSATSNYTDYRPDPTKKINLIAGSVNNIISVTKSGSVLPANANVTVWVDFNGNGIFDSSERVLVATNANPTVNQSFNVPITVAKCDVTMRVVYSNNILTDGCGNFGYGEVEDYGVYFTAASELSVNEAHKNKEFNIYPNPVSDVLTISGMYSETDFKIYNSVGQVVNEGTTKNKSVNVQNLVKGVYFIQFNGKDNPVKLKFIKK